MIRHPWKAAASEADTQATPADDAVVTLAGVTRRFGTKTALDDVSLSIPRGSVFGLVGENGSGKTTLIKHVIGLLRARSGTVRVFGWDPVREPVKVLSRIGYLSEARDLPAWMRVDEFLRYMAGFYRSWDQAYAERLRERLDVPLTARIGSLSMGQIAKVGLLSAQAHRPELLLLDEPSSGLDPVVRREILEAIIRAVSDAGHTVLFSSHLLDEIERVCDHVAMIHHGRIVFSGQLDDMKERHHRLTLRFAAPQAEAPSVEGALSVVGSGREWSILCDGDLDTARASARRHGADVLEQSIPTLDEIFVARVGWAPGRSEEE